MDASAKALTGRAARRCCRKRPTSPCGAPRARQRARAPAARHRAVPLPVRRAGRPRAARAAAAHFAHPARQHPQRRAAPHRRVHAVRIRRLVGEQLQQHHAKRVHVALLAQLQRLAILRVNVAVRAHAPRGGVRGRGRQHAAQPHVRHQRAARVVQQDIGALHVAVDDALRVQLRQAARGASGDVRALQRRERGGRAGTAAHARAQPVAERAAAHQRVDEALARVVNSLRGECGKRA